MKQIHLALLTTFVMVLEFQPLEARCNKSGLEKLMNIRKILCAKDKYNAECKGVDKDIKSYLASFASGNNLECDRLHKTYNAPDKAVIEQHHLNVKKK